MTYVSSFPQGPQTPSQRRMDIGIPEQGRDYNQHQQTLNQAWWQDQPRWDEWNDYQRQQREYDQNPRQWWETNRLQSLSPELQAQYQQLAASGAPDMSKGMLGPTMPGWSHLAIGQPPAKLNNWSNGPWVAGGMYGQPPQGIPGGGQGGGGQVGGGQGGGGGTLPPLQANIQARSDYPPVYTNQQTQDATNAAVATAHQVNVPWLLKQNARGGMSGRSLGGVVMPQYAAALTQGNVAQQSIPFQHAQANAMNRLQHQDLGWGEALGYANNALDMRNAYNQAQLGQFNNLLEYLRRITG